MFEQVLVPLAGWALLMALASAAGLALVGAWPWAPRAREAGVALAAGLGAAPLLAGLAMVAVLAVLPGAPARTQAGVAFGLLGVAGLAGWISGATRRALVPGRDLLPSSPAAVLACGFFVALLLDAATVPLIQNDALEYATVGRILFDTRDLASYPVLQAQGHPSGFYGPWTHPPLYVALLELGFALQGTSGHTLLMRLVAPWCLGGAALCIAALVRWADPARPQDGPLAALLLVSAPLLFLGAASALIDALPVLGMTLAFVAVAALSTPAPAPASAAKAVAASAARAAPSPRWWPRALCIGIMLGLALWTHSQAVLFAPLLLPLLALQGRGPWPARLPAALTTGVLALAAALVVGSAPYLRNVALFGTPVSDNPLVFTLPSLDWASYFRQQRGLGSFGELVQYGLLKPWFAVEAYSIVFWLALPALLQRRQPLPSMPDESMHVPALALATVGLYLAGALLAVMLGVDLMVRNERYMLVLLPAAAILAARAMRGPRLRGAIVLLLGMQLAVLVLYRLGQLNAERQTRAGALAGESTRLQRWGPYGAVDFLRRETPASSLVLSMKPADMFYAGRTMLSYLDPRLQAFYGESEPRAAAQRLRDLGVTHVHLPDYWLPPVYNSALESVLADPRLAELSFDAAGYQIYRLRAPGEAATPSRIACAASLPFAGWQRSRELVLGGRKNLRRVSLGAAAPLPPEAVSASWNRTPLFLRETNTVLRSEVVLPLPPLPPLHSAPAKATEWLLVVELQGEGHVQVLARQRGSGGTPQLVAEQPLAAASGVQVLQRRLRIDGEAQRVELRLEHRAGSWLKPISARLTPVCAEVDR